MSRWTNRTAFQTPADILKSMGTWTGLWVAETPDLRGETTPVYWRDHSGSGNHLPIANSGIVKSASNVLGGRSALTWGTGDTGYFEGVSLLSGTSQFVVCVVAPSTHAASDEAIIAGADEAYSFFIGRDASSDSTWRFGADEGALADMLQFSMTNAVGHVLCCVRTLGNRYVYVDGVLVASAFAESSAALTCNFNIGGDAFLSPFRGSLALVGVAQAGSALVSLTSDELLEMTLMLRDYYNTVSP